MMTIIKENMNKVLVIVTSILLIIFLILLFSPKKGSKAVEVENVLFERNSISLTVGDTYYLKVVVSPSNATNKEVTYSSGNPDIATVDASGYIKAIKAGMALVTVSTNNGHKDECVVSVMEKSIPVTSIELEYEDIILTEDESVSLKVKVTPDNTTEHTFKWISDNPSVATVDASGKVTAVSAGETSILVTTANKSKALCNIEVKEKVSSFEFKNPPTAIVLGETLPLKITTVPNDADVYVNWKSSDDSIATVSDGKVKALKAGDVTITATIGSVKKSLTLKVVRQITMNKKIASINEGSTVTLTINQNVSNITWTSNNNGIARVNNGVVTGVGSGTAIITAKTADGIEATVAVVVIGKNSKLINSYDSATFKYWIQKESYLASTHIWVEDAYEQLKVAHPLKYIHPTEIIKNEVNNKGYQNKGLVATNASVSTGNGRPAINFVLDDGKVIASGGHGNYNVIGLNKNYELKSYPPNNSGKEQALQEGVKYTFGFYPVLIINGVYQSQNVAALGGGVFTGNNIRQAVCQVDKNNFIIFTNVGIDATQASRQKKGISLENLAKLMIKYNCKNGYNLDGGTSTVYIYKKANSALNQLTTFFRKPGRDDMLYFVEK